MNREQRRVRNRLGALLADPYRKLASIVLAVGLWFFLNSQIHGDLLVTMPLVTVGNQRTVGEVPASRLAIVLPTDRVVQRRFLDGEHVVDTVQVKLSGPRYLIDTLTGEPLDLQISSFLALDWQNRASVEFTAADIQRNLRALQELHIELQPPRITLEVERIDATDLPLSLGVVDLQMDEELAARLRRETAEFSPDVVRVLGPASSLDQLRTRIGKPLRARLRSSGNERQLTAILELAADPELGLRLATTPSMTVQVQPILRVFELELPLDVDDLALPAAMRGQFHPDAKTRMVRIKAGGELRARLVALGEDADRKRLHDWAAAHLRLSIWIPPLEPGAAYGPEIVREARLVLRGPLQTTADRNDFALAETVSVTLRRTP
jgi:hypothetical protein